MQAVPAGMDVDDDAELAEKWDNVKRKLGTDSTELDELRNMFGAKKAKPQCEAISGMSSAIKALASGICCADAVAMPVAQLGGGQPSGVVGQAPLSPASGLRNSLAQIPSLPTPTVPPPAGMVTGAQVAAAMANEGGLQGLQARINEQAQTQPPPHVLAQLG